MRKSILLLVLACLIGSYSSIASPVSLPTAQIVAANFYKINVPSASASLQPALIYTRSEANGTLDFYVFNITPGTGFVIVAADDAIEPVIGYSSESDFDLTAMDKTGLKDWMKTAAAKIAGAVQNHVVADATIANLWHAYKTGISPVSARATSVAPLVTTTWNQEPYYNQLCPFNSTDNQRCVTGCVATAMAQIMKFWNYPTTGNGSYSYNDATSAGFSYNYGVQSANFGATTYAWASMPASISANNTSIATLMYHCGVAVAMDYGDDNEDGSGAWVLQSEAGAGNPCAQYAYANYFKYNSATLQGVKYASYTSSTWTTLMENELNAGRPIQYEGDDPSAGGHTWVCDGYNTSNQLHMNWGWGGVDNGYFSVTNLSVGGYTFSANDAALIGIQPLTTTTCNVPSGLTSSAITTTGATVSWAAVSGTTSYSLQYKTAAATTWTTVSVTTTSQALTGLTAGTTYDYQVSTICSGGSSAYSSASTFATSTASSCGTPSGLASASVTTTGATVSWSAVTGATSYSLQYKTAAATSWTTVSQTATSKALTGLTSGTTYDFQVAATCAGGTSAYSAVSTFTTSTATVTYCASHGTSQVHEWISHVELGAINRTSGAETGGYINTGLVTNLRVGSTNDTIYFSPGFAGSAYKEYWAIYIDYNKNGVFTDAGEQVVSGTTTTTGNFYAVISVPSGLSLGNTRMRVVMSHTAITSSCSTLTRGEVEDYTVNLSNTALSADINGTPVPHDDLQALSADRSDDQSDLMSLYPNPAQTTITINAISQDNSTSVINVFDLTGQKVLSVERQNVMGVNAHEVDINALPSGVYIVEVSNNGDVKRRKFTVAK